MRILTVAPGPDFSVQDVHRGWTKGLAKAGAQVREFNLNDRLAVYTAAEMEGRPVFSVEAAHEVVLEGLRGQLWAFQPEVVVVTSGFFTPPALLDAMRARGHKVVMIHTESPYEDLRQVGVAAHCDLNIVNDPTNLDRFPKGTVYVPHAYDPDVHHARWRANEWDFSFVGTGYPSRVDWFEQVAWPEPERVCLAGNWENLDEDSPLVPLIGNEPGTCVDNDEAADIYRRTLVGLNRYRREAERDDLVDGWAMGPREVELAACGVFFGRDPRPESDAVFPMLPIINDPAELTDLLHWAKAHPDLRSRAAEQAAEAIADRTFENHARDLLALLDV